MALEVQFTESMVPFDEDGRIAVAFIGVYEGPATCLQVLLEGTDPRLDGLVATSGEIPVGDGSAGFLLPSFQLGWPAFTFDQPPPDTTFDIIATIVETDCNGTVIGPVAQATQPFRIIDSQDGAGVFPPPFGGEVRAINFIFSGTRVPFDVQAGNGGDRVSVSITGEYRGPSTFFQARIGATIPALAGLEGVSAETPVDGSVDFQPFDTLVSGGIGFQAFSFAPGETFDLFATLVETTGLGNATQVDETGIIREIAFAQDTLVITGTQAPALSNLSFDYFPTTIDDDVPNSIVLTVNGSYRGPATFIQARLGIDDLAFLGPPILEAVSLDFAVGPSLDTFVPFSAMVTGGLATPADFFTGPDTRTLRGRVAETTGQGTPGLGDEPGIVGILATNEVTLIINVGAPAVVTFRELGKTPFIAFSNGFIQWNVPQPGSNPAMSSFAGFKIRTLVDATYRISVSNLSMTVFGFFLLVPANFRLSVRDVTAGFSVLAFTDHLFGVGETFLWDIPEFEVFIPALHELEVRLDRFPPPPITFFSVFPTSVGNAAARWKVEQLS